MDAYHFENMSECANATARESGEIQNSQPGTASAASNLGSFSESVRVSEARIEPVGSVSRVICVTIAPSYDRSRTMVRWLRKSLLLHEALGRRAATQVVKWLRRTRLFGKGHGVESRAVLNVLNARPGPLRDSEVATSINDTHVS